MRWLWKNHHREISAEGSGHVLARGLSEVRLLRLSTRGGWLDPLHKGKPYSLQARLPQTLRQHRLLCSVQQSDTSVRDGHESTSERLSSGVLRLSTVQPQVLRRGSILSLRKQDTVRVRLRGEACIRQHGTASASYGDPGSHQETSYASSAAVCTTGRRPEASERRVGPQSQRISASSEFEFSQRSQSDEQSERHQRASHVRRQMTIEVRRSRNTKKEKKRKAKGVRKARHITKKKRD